MWRALSWAPLDNLALRLFMAPWLGGYQCSGALPRTFHKHTLGLLLFLQVVEMSFLVLVEGFGNAAGCGDAEAVQGECQPA
jgi:hypothetical protein